MEVEVQRIESYYKRLEDEIQNNNFITVIREVGEYHINSILFSELQFNNTIRKIFFIHAVESETYMSKTFNVCIKLETVCSKIMVLFGV